MTAVFCAIFLSGCWGLVPTATGQGQAGAKLTAEQIADIRLDCRQQDYIIMILERQLGKRETEPESLGDEDRKINAQARSKIWQLRTYCQ